MEEQAAGGADMSEDKARYGKMSKEPKPCPFCGCTRILVEEDTIARHAYAHCTQCCSTGPDMADRRVAIMAWNNRADSGEVALTIKEIEFMYHAVGMEDYVHYRQNSRTYNMYRNYYGAGPADVPIWDGLVEKGLAKKSAQHKDTYYVSEAGISILERLTLKKFKEG